MRYPALLPRRLPEATDQHPGQYDRLSARCPEAWQPPLPPLSRQFHPPRSAEQSAHRTNPAWRCAGLADRATDGARVSQATRLTPGAPAIQSHLALVEPCRPRELPLSDSDSQQWGRGSAAALSDATQRCPASFFQTEPLRV